MKTFYRVDKLTNHIIELSAEDLIDDICLMRSESTKDGRFFELVQDYLIKQFWFWQCEHPEEVDPDFQIFDCIEDAQEQRRDDKINQEIYESNFKDFLKD